jgi:hypothetical protein
VDYLSRLARVPRRVFVGLCRLVFRHRWVLVGYGYVVVGLHLLKPVLPHLAKAAIAESATTALKFADFADFVDFSQRCRGVWGGGDAVGVGGGGRASGLGGAGVVDVITRLCGQYFAAAGSVVAGWGGATVRALLWEGPLPMISFVKLAAAVGGGYLGHFTASQKQRAIAAFHYSPVHLIPPGQPRGGLNVFVGHTYTICDCGTVLTGAYLFWVLPFSEDPVARCLIGCMAVLLGAGIVDEAVGQLRGGEERRMGVVNAPVRAVSLCLVHLVDEHIVAVFGVGLILSSLDLLRWAAGGDAIFFTAVVAPVSQNLGLHWVYAFVNGVLHGVVPAGRIAGLALWWDANVSWWFDGALVLWCVGLAPAVVSVVSLLRMTYELYNSNQCCWELVVYCFCLPALVLSMMWIGVWNSVMMPAHVAALVIVRDVRCALPASLIGALQGLQLIGVDYKIRGLDRVFTTPATIIHSFLSQIYVACTGILLKVYNILAPAAWWLLDMAAMWWGLVVSGVLCVVLLVWTGCTWLYLHRLLVAGVIAEAVSLAQLCRRAATLGSGGGGGGGGWGRGGGGERVGVGDPHAGFYFPSGDADFYFPSLVSSLPPASSSGGGGLLLEEDASSLHVWTTPDWVSAAAQLVGVLGRDKKKKSSLCIVTLFI